MSRLLPLFPLQLVVFPGSELPLHIFEDRYKEMVGEAEASGTEFGVVLAKDDGIVNTGCSVLVETILQRYPDGRFDVMTRGQRRFEIASLDEQKPYLRGHIDYFDDDDFEPVTSELRSRAIVAYGRLQETDEDHHLGSDPDPDHPLLSFQLADVIDDLDFRNMLLRNRSEADRLRQFASFITEYIPRRQYAARMKRLTPLNGSGHKPANL